MLYIYAIIRENEGDRRKSVPESIKQNMEGSRVEEERYLISDAARIVEVEAHVLRYWEEELELQIHRNELGHRYYTGYDIQLFLNIKELKKRGLQLRAIKNLIPQITASMTGFGESASTLLEGEVIDHAEVKTDRDLKEKISKKDEGKNDKILEFQAILERLITQELKAQNEDEERCRSLDYAIRRQQLARKEAAAAAEKKSGRRHRDK